jgi:hypothetical protein
MENPLLIGSAVLFVAYIIFTETLDWVGRIELIREHFPKFPKFLERRTFRVALLIVAIGLLIRVATERDGKNVDTAASSSPTSRNAPSSDDKKSEPPRQSPEGAPTATPNLRTKTPKKRQQDNSVHIGKYASLPQNSTGNCSPNIVGGSNTVNCSPPAQKSGLELTVSLVGATAPAIVVDNQTDNLAEGLVWELVMFRTTDQMFFSYATQNIGYVKPHSKSARELMQLNTLVQAPGGGGQIANGESFVGTLSIDCPSCRGTTLIVSFVWGTSGWFYKVPDGDGRLILPKDMSKGTVSQFIESVNTAITPATRIPII